MFLSRCFNSAIFCFSLLTFFPAVSHAYQANFSWLYNSEDNVAGYKIHYGTSPENYTTVIDVGLSEPVDGRLYAAVDDLQQENTYYFAATAYTTTGEESGFSSEIVLCSECDSVVETTISSGADDAEEAVGTGNVDLTSSDLEMIQNSTEQLVGLRFNNLEIPQNATITNAWIQFTVDESTTDFTSLAIEGQHSGDAAPFTASAYNISSRDRTLSAVSWQPSEWSTIGASGPDQLTADISIIVQEIVSLADWTNGNSMVFIISGEGKRVAESYDGDASAAAELHVEFKTGPVNQTPVVTAGADQTIMLPADTAVLDGTVTDDGLPVDTLQTEWKHVGGTGIGSVTIAAPYAVDTTVTFGDSGTYILELTADDGEFVSVDSMTITVQAAVNPSTPPVANDLSVNGSEDSPITNQLTAGNSNGLPLQYTVVSLPSHGTLSLETETGSFTFNPAPNFNGTDRFTFMAANDNGESNIAAVEVVINPVNDVPSAYPASFATLEDSVVSGQLTADDPDGDVLQYVIATNPGQGTASINSNGSFTYAPAANSSGTDSFSYKVNDGSLNSSSATVTISVTGVNDAPVAENSTITVDADTTIGGQLHAEDPEGTALSYFLTSPPNQGSVTINPDGTFSYTADKDSSGKDSFSFKADDGASTSNTAIVTIIIQPAAPSLIFEAGEVDVDHNPVFVDFEGSFTNPVVIAAITSKNGEDPCVVRLGTVTSIGFDIWLQEYEYLDGLHATEQVNYIVIEAGHYTLADGSQLEAGSISAGASFSRSNFNKRFTTTPVVITSIATVNDNNAVTARIRKINQDGFGCKVQEQEINRQNHAPETVNYLAWEPSAGLDNGIRYEVARTGNNITHEAATVEFSSSFSNAPLIISDMQTADGRDTSTLRTLEVSSLELQLQIEEEQSKDSEITHTTENTGFIAILAE